MFFVKGCSVCGTYAGTVPVKHGSEVRQSAIGRCDAVQKSRQPHCSAEVSPWRARSWRGATKRWVAPSSRILKPTPAAAFAAVAAGATRVQLYQLLWGSPGFRSLSAVAQPLCQPAVQRLPCRCCWEGELHRHLKPRSRARHLRSCRVCLGVSPRLRTCRRRWTNLADLRGGAMKSQRKQSQQAVGQRVSARKRP